MSDNKELNAIFSVIIGIAALNWALVAFFDTNLLTDTLSMAQGSQEYNAVVGTVALVVGIRWYSIYQWVSS